MNSIPLVRARYANAFLMALKKRGVTTGSYVKSARLPESLLLNPDGLISALSLWKLAGDIGRDPDQRDIGLEAGALPISAYGDFGRRVTCAPSLYKAIKTLKLSRRSATVQLPSIPDPIFILPGTMISPGFAEAPLKAQWIKPCK
jgi:hypothetical protein